MTTWRKTDAEDYYYETQINELIEAAYETAFERAYAEQCKRELAMWDRRRNSDIGSPRS